MTREQIAQLAKVRHIEAQFRPDAWHEELTAFAIEIANAALEEAIVTSPDRTHYLIEKIRALKIKPC